MLTTVLFLNSPYSVGPSQSAQYPPTLKKVLVLAVVKNKMQRRLYEDSFVKKLRDTGITAIASYTKLPELSDDKDVNIKKIKALVAETGVDYISIGALTHSVKNHDFTLLFEEL